MSFSPSFLEELRREIGHLRDQREQLSARIQILENLLNEGPPAQPAFWTTGEVQRNSSDATVKGVVLNALRQRPGVKAAEITQILRRQGFKTNGPTRLSHRVYNELWRMARDGEITKTPDGRFIPKEGVVP